MNPYHGIKDNFTRYAVALGWLLACPSAIAVQWQSVECAADLSAAITTKGVLYVTGGRDSSVGDGRTFSLLDSKYRKYWSRLASNVASVSVSSSHSLYVTRNGNLFAAGSNTYGQLGIGSTKNKPRWTRTMTNVTSAVVDKNRSFTVRKDGTLWVTGANEQGDYKSSDYTGYLYSVSWVKSLDGVKTVVPGDTSAYAITTDDDLWRIRYSFGLSTNATPAQWSPIDTGVLAAAKDSYFFLEGLSFLKSDNSVWNGDIWGGLKNVKQYASDVKRIKGTPQGLLMLHSDGSLEIYNHASAPVTINQNVADFCAGSAHAMVVKNDGSLWAAGNNNRGQFGFQPGRGTSSLQEWVQVRLR